MGGFPSIAQPNQPQAVTYIYSTCHIHICIATHLHLHICTHPYYTQQMHYIHCLCHMYLDPPCTTHTHITHATTLFTHIWQGMRKFIVSLIGVAWWWCVCLFGCGHVYCMLLASTTYTTQTVYMQCTSASIGPRIDM